MVEINLEGRRGGRAFQVAEESGTHVCRQKRPAERSVLRKWAGSGNGCSQELESRMARSEDEEVG